MKGFDPQWYEQYKLREARRKVSSPQPQQAVCDGPLAAEAPPERSCQRFLVSIVSFRRRLCDSDNLTGKGFVDCLRYSGFIPEDSPDLMDYRISQQKVRTKEEERTEITITPL